MINYTDLLKNIASPVQLLINLLQEKKRKKILINDKVIQPLYEDMSIVACEYLTFFTHAEIYIKSLKKSPDNYSELLSILRMQREQVYNIRWKSEKIAESLIEKSKDKEIIAMAELILEFIWDCSLALDIDLRLDIVHSSDATYLMDVLENNNQWGLSFDKFKETMISKIDNKKWFLEEKWKELSHAYAKLNMRYIT